MSGWIKIHRAIKDHWLYTEKRTFSKFEAWNDILLTVNYLPAKVSIKGKLYEIKRGQSILSLDSWAKRWGWNKSKVRRFMSLLQKEKMIELISDTTTTQLTVCKYDTYQDERHTDETQTKRKRNANDTRATPIKEEEEEKEEKEFNFKNSLLSFGFEKSLVSDWLKVRKKKNLTNTEVAFNDFVNEINKRPNVDKNEVLKYIVIKSWGGFKWEWYDKEKPQSKQPQEQKTLLWYDFWDIPAYDKYCKENNITPDYTTKPNGK